MLFEPGLPRLAAEEAVPIKESVEGRLLEPRPQCPSRG